MKKRMRRLSTLLSLMMCLLFLCPGARAAGDKIIGAKGFAGDYATYEVCVIGDKVWMRTVRDVQIYDVQTGETASYPWSDEVTNMDGGQFEDGMRYYRSIKTWFAWRGEVYALCESLRTGRNETIYEGLSLWRVAIADGQANLESAGSVDWEALGQENYIQIDRSLAVGDTLFAQYYDDSTGDFALAAMPLDGSSTTVVKVRAGECRGLCLYDGGLLAVVLDYDNGTTYLDLFDPQSLTYSELGHLNARGFYCPAQEKDGARVLLTDMNNSQVIAWDPASGQTEVIAPLTVSVHQAQGFMTDSGVYVAGNFEGVALIQTVNRVEAEVELVICDESNFSDALDQALISFPNNHPEISVRRTQSADDNVLEQLMARTDDVDIYVLTLGYGDASTIEAVMNRQWGAPIKSEVIESLVADMYPALSQACTGADGVFIVPLSAEVSGQLICTAALEALNLTIDDVPTNWPEMLDFLGTLATDDCPVPLGMWETGEEAYADLGQCILKTYQLTIQAGINQDYDTPELRAAFEALDRLDLEKVAALSASYFSDEYGTDESAYDDNPLLDTYQFCSVDGCTFTDGYHMMLSMTADRPASMPIRGAVAIINPASKHVDEAVAFLEECVGYLGEAAQATLCPNRGEAKRSANYEEQKEQQRQQVEAYEAQLAQAEEIDKPLIQQYLDSAKNWLAEMDDYYWDISPQSLEWYRAHDDDVRFDVNADLGGMRIYSRLTQAYANGEGRTDALLAELQRQAVMRRLEAG